VSNVPTGHAETVVELLLKQALLEAFADEANEEVGELRLVLSGRELGGCELVGTENVVLAHWVSLVDE
jgi:hypothetical protein